MWFDTFSRQKDDKGLPLTVNGLPEEFRGTGYVFSKELDAAVDVAIGLGRPLLVSGEPGSGKTELGFAIARRLGIGRLYFFSTRSVSEARDLFYTYDAIGRFRDANLRRDASAADDGGSPADYVEYQALGAAILDAHSYLKVRHMLEGRRAYRHPEDPQDAPEKAAEDASGKAPGIAQEDLDNTLPDIQRRPQRTVVIIDEIDKASRDFPNDVLAEIETLKFAVPELGRGNAPALPPGSEIEKRERPETPAFPNDMDLRPIVVITSNEERQLPDAFLRRCVFHEIPFPTDRLHDIIANNLDRRFKRTKKKLVLSADDRAELIRIVEQYRQAAVDKKAGVSEIVDAAFLLAHLDGTQAPDLDERLKAAVVALAKLKNDRDVLSKILARRAGAG